MSIRTRLKQLENKASQAPRVTVWDVIAGVATPDDLPLDRREWWDANTQDLFTMGKPADPFASLFRELAAQHQPAGHHQPAGGEGFPPGEGPSGPLPTTQESDRE